MPGGLVLVIEDDEWVSRLLSAAIRDAGYDVVVCGTAKAGLDTACAVEPDCIICDVDLPDHDGYHVARNVRTQPSRVAVTPFLFLSGLDDQESRLEGFHVGADVYMTKPFRVDEVVAQVGALVQMAARLRARRDSFLSIPAAEGSAIEGDLGQMSIATVLTVLEMERRTGTFEVISKKRRAQLDIAAGFIVQGTVGGTEVSPLAALRTMLGWNVGRFSFAPLPGRDPPTAQKSIGAFLIEAVRLEDETAREAEGASSRRSGELRGGAALGGPPSGPDDLTPPSSRSGDALQALRERETADAFPAPGRAPPRQPPRPPPPPTPRPGLDAAAPDRRAGLPPPPPRPGPPRPDGGKPDAVRPKK
jgi:two-component system, OmpR family, response regulator